MKALRRPWEIYASRRALKFGLTGLANTGLGEVMITALVLHGLPLWAASPLTTYASIWSDYGFKAKVVYHEPLSWRRLLRYHANGLASKAVQVSVTVGLGLVLPFQLTYFLGVVLGFAANFAVADMFTFRSPLQRRLLSPPTEAARVNLGCPYLCEGYRCVDIKPEDEGVVAGDAVEFLNARAPGRYDEVFSKNMLEHLPNPGAFVAAAARSLRRGGRLVLVTDNAEFVPFYFPFWLNHTGMGAHSRPDYARRAEHGHGRHFAVYTKMHLVNLAEEYGLKVESVRRITLCSRLKMVAVKPGPAGDDAA